MYRNVNGQDHDYYYLGGKLVANKKHTTITYLHSDYLGSPAAESSSSGTVTDRMYYQPFGESIGTTKDDVGYTGHKFDTDLGLSYMQARYYDPVIGRFYSNDPVGYTAKNPVMSFNRYLYVNNNPYKYTDPDGEFFNVALGGFGAVVGAIGGGVSAALSGGDFKDIVTSAGIGAATGGMAGLTLGTSLVATVATGAAVGLASDLAGQTISNFDADSVDTSSLGSALESAGSELADAVGQIDGTQAVVSTALGAFGGSADKLAKTMQFSDKASAVITETTNVLTSSHKEELSK